MIKVYGYDLVADLIIEDDATIACQHIQLCKHSQILVGTDRCTFGPSYWCQSEDNADECFVSNKLFLESHKND